MIHNFMKKIAILGAGGFVGRSLCEYFRTLSGSYDVVGVRRSDFSLLDGDAVASFIEREKPDVVINCASEGGARKTGYGDGGGVVENNLRMFFNVERALPDETLYIFFGSGVQYDKSRDLAKVRETSLGERIPADPYGFSKYVLAKYVENGGRKMTLYPTIFGLFGPNEDYTYKFISNACVKNMLGMDIRINQNVRFDYLYVDDFCAIIAALIENGEPRHRVFNITPTQSVTLTELAEAVNRAGTGKSAISVANGGMNFEYTGSNRRLFENIGREYRFLPYEESVARLYKALEKNLASLDTDAVRADDAIKHCKTRETPEKA